ncbi:hypothetical protein EMCRGX_G025274 [Ephydatia muelleri]
MTEEDPSPKRYHEDASVPRRLIVSKRATERKRNFLTQEYYNQYSVPIDISSWTIKECNACTIRQTNAVDCGILLCKFADCIVKKLPLTFSTSSTWLRSWLAMRLIHPSSKINYEDMRSIFLSLCKDFVPQDVQDALQRVFPKRQWKWCSNLL